MLQAQAELSSELGRTDESGQSEVSEDQAGDESSAKQSQEATNAYQVISGVGSNDVSANPPFILPGNSLKTSCFFSLKPPRCA